MREGESRSERGARLKSFDPLGAASRLQGIGQVHYLETRSPSEQSKIAIAATSAAEFAARASRTNRRGRGRNLHLQLVIVLWLSVVYKMNRNRNKPRDALVSIEPTPGVQSTCNVSISK